MKSYQNYEMNFEKLKDIDISDFINKIDYSPKYIKPKQPRLEEDKIIEAFSDA